jgi:DNA-binding response OmpR family regulator
LIANLTSRAPGPDELLRVITDINLRRLDGRALFRKIHELPEPQPKVVLITQGSEHHAIAAVRAGACDYISGRP